MGLNWPIISPKLVRWPIFFIIFFEIDIGWEHLREDLKETVR